MDLGYDKGTIITNSNAGTKTDGNEPVTNLNGGNATVDKDGNPITVIGAASETEMDKGHPKVPVIAKDGNDDDKEKGDGDKDKDADKGANDLPHELAVGTSLELEGVTYTVNDKGDVVDDKGEVFKPANEVKDWIESLDKEDDESNAVSVQALQELVGVKLVDENNKPIEYDNSPEGVVAYINDVVESNKEEAEQNAIKRLIEKYPVLPDVINYYVANGNSLEGYNQTVDRSSIVIDENNTAQQEAIVREAYKEKGLKGDVDAYIQYLKSSNILLSTAQAELEGLQQKDQEIKAETAKRAEEAEAKRQQEEDAYWGKVKEAISSKTIAGYQIPDTIVITKNGQRSTATPNDFYNYVYQVDENGRSAYENDLSTTTAAQRMNDDLLKAYLKFTGGDYSSLVKMAINKENVTNLKFKAKETKSNSAIKITPPNGGKSGGSFDVGYK